MKSDTNDAEGKDFYETPVARHTYQPVSGGHWGKASEECLTPTTRPVGAKGRAQKTVFIRPHLQELDLTFARSKG